MPSGFLPAREQQATRRGVLPSPIGFDGDHFDIEEEQLSRLRQMLPDRPQPGQDGFPLGVRTEQLELQVPETEAPFLSTWRRDSREMEARSRCSIR